MLNHKDAFFCFSTLKKKKKSLLHIRWASATHTDSFKKKKHTAFLCVSVFILCSVCVCITQYSLKFISLDFQQMVTIMLKWIIICLRWWRWLEKSQQQKQLDGWKEQAATKIITFYTWWTPNCPLSSTVPSCSATAGSPSCRDSRTGWRGCYGTRHRSRPSLCAWGRPPGYPPSSRMLTPAERAPAWTHITSLTLLLLFLNLYHFYPIKVFRWGVLLFQIQDTRQT